MSISEFSINPKKHIRTCRYNKCKHNGKIDLYTDEYVTYHKGHYYHTDCWDEFEKSLQQKEKIKKDLQYIRNQWVSNINNTVIYGELNRCLNDLLARGVTSDYLVFTIDYVINHHLNLRHPMGFKYFVDKDCIKKAYSAKLKKEAQQNTTLSIDNPTDSPSFKINQPKPSGFGSILRGGKK